MTASASWLDGTHSSWIGLSARLQPIAARLAGRTDVIVRIHPRSEPTTAAAGWDFLLPRGEIALDAHAVLEPFTDDPADIDPSTARDRSRHPMLFGSLCAAAAHARHTTWSMPLGTPGRIAAMARQLESARALAAFLVDRAAYRTWLRAACRVLVPAPERTTVVDRSAAVGVLALRLAGVLSASEAAPVQARLGTLIGASGLTSLEALLDEALALPDGDREGLLDVARRAVSLVEGSPGTDSRVDLTDHALAASVATAVSDVAAAASALAAGAEGAPTLRSRSREVDADARGIAAAAFHSTFRARGPNPSTTVREPDSELVSQARALAQALRRARHRSPLLTAVPSRTPPGRLRLSEAMRREAQHAARAEMTAQPWLQSRRRQVDPPVFRLGLSWDTSRSRSARQAQSADLAWALAWAVGHVQGRFSAVSWSSSARPVVWPGRLPDKVVEPHCHGGSSGCPESIRALDGALQLSGSTGPRLLVILTDGRQPNRRHVDSEVDWLVSRGVRILWVTEAQDSWAPAGSLRLALPVEGDAAAALGEAVCGIFGGGGSLTAPA